MLIDAKNLLKNAKKNNVAVPAFNISSIEALQAVFYGAKTVKAPVIIESSAGETNYLSAELVVETSKILSKKTNVDYVLHLDRGNDLELMEKCLKAGYNSISADFNMDLAENITKSKLARDLTNHFSAQLEGAVEYVPYVGYKKMEDGDLQYTNIDQATTYTKEVNPDSLVISIGTQSGKYKEISKIKYEILDEANKVFPELPFVLHGGSFLEDDIIHKSISKGISKINYNSELRIAFTDQLKKNIAKNPSEYAPYRILKGTADEMQLIVEKKLKLLNTSKLETTKNEK